MSLTAGIAPACRQDRPGPSLGILALSKVDNQAPPAPLQEAKAELERQLAARFASRQEIKDDPRVAAYRDHYKRFKKTYHVQQQLESVACKGKSIPLINPLVSAMFMAELSSRVLTAGHDLALVTPPLTLDRASGQEQFVALGGKTRQLPAGELFIRDANEILSVVIYGPDNRTMITPATTSAVFTAYGVPGIEPSAVAEHLETLAGYVRAFSPQAQVDTLEVLT